MPGRPWRLRNKRAATPDVTTKDQDFANRVANGAAPLGRRWGTRASSGPAHPLRRKLPRRARVETAPVSTNTALANATSAGNAGRTAPTSRWHIRKLGAPTRPPHYKSRREFRKQNRRWRLPTRVAPHDRDSTCVLSPCDKHGARPEFKHTEDASCRAPPTLFQMWGSPLSLRNERGGSGSNAWANLKETLEHHPCACWPAPAWGFPGTRERNTTLPPWQRLLRTVHSGYVCGNNLDM